jgi:hypothetical protein
MSADTVAGVGDLTPELLAADYWTDAMVSGGIDTRA